MSIFSRLRDRLRPRPAENAGALSEIDWLVGLTGHRPEDPAWYRQALMHRSALKTESDDGASNERLEFLGDAILGLIVADELFARYPDVDEGFLTKLRAKLVNGKTLASCARSIGLGQHVVLSENMERASGRSNRSILSDAYEALVGAIYLDQGLVSARTFVERTLLHIIDLEELARSRDNYKSMLLELSQAHAWPQPTYSVASEEGPDHDKVFTIDVYIGGRQLGTGTASSKKSAEQKAAREAFERLSGEPTGEHHNPL